MGDLKFEGLSETPLSKALRSGQACFEHLRSSLRASGLDRLVCSHEARITWRVQPACATRPARPAALLLFMKRRVVLSELLFTFQRALTLSVVSGRRKLVDELQPVKHLFNFFSNRFAFGFCHSLRRLVRCWVSTSFSRRRGAEVRAAPRRCQVVFAKIVQNNRNANSARFGQGTR